MKAAAMLTPNVGHGHAVAGCGNASASAARASVPSAPPAKMAAISGRSILGTTARVISGSPLTTPPLPGFLNSLAGPLDHYGLWAVLLFVMIEDFGIPVPGETILIAASVYAGAGRLTVVLVAVVAFAAAVTGDNIGFAIG